MATIMIHTHEYYVKNPHHIIKKSVYENIIKICKKNKKRLAYLFVMLKLLQSSKS